MDVCGVFLPIGPKLSCRSLVHGHFDRKASLTLREVSFTFSNSRLQAARGGRADKGITITTGRFIAEARREASRDGVPSIELIDGEKLVDLLESLELGLRSVPAYALAHAFYSEFRAT